MKSLVLSAFLVGIVSAQSLAGLPTCAYPCVQNSIPASCNLNPSCICSAKAFIEAVTCCVASVCSKADQEATIKYAASICNPAGVTITQTAAVCSSTTAANGTAASTSKMTTSSGSSASSVSSSVSSVVSSASSAASVASTSSAGAGQALVAQGGNIVAAIVGAAAFL